MTKARIDGNKMYLRSAFGEYDFIVGIGKGVIAFGKTEEVGESFIHMKKEDWTKLKEFIDDNIGRW